MPVLRPVAVSTPRFCGVPLNRPPNTNGVSKPKLRNSTPTSGRVMLVRPPGLVQAPVASSPAPVSAPAIARLRAPGFEKLNWSEAMIS
jgi:hypothetical protein